MSAQQSPSPATMTARAASTASAAPPAPVRPAPPAVAGRADAGPGPALLASAPQVASAPPAPAPTQLHDGDNSHVSSTSVTYADNMLFKCVYPIISANVKQKGLQLTGNLVKKLTNKISEQKKQNTTC